MAATVWRGRLVFGMVSIPVRLYKAARRERIKFHHVYKRPESTESAPESEDEEDIAAPPLSRATVRELPEPGSQPVVAEPSLARVRNMPVEENTQSPLETRQVFKGYEIEKDRYVTFEPAEIAAVRPKTSTEMTIAEFVRLAEIDPVFFETSYYAAADRGGEKAYALLYRALAETGYAAVGSVAMHGREHATVIRPGKHGLIVHTLFFQNEVRADEEYHGDPALVNAKELELAKTFVRAFAATFNPGKLKDTFEERLRELIQARAETAIPSRESHEVPRRAPVMDIMEALRKSLEMARKPPASQKSAPPAEAIPPRRKRSR